MERDKKKHRCPLSGSVQMQTSPRDLFKFWSPIPCLKRVKLYTLHICHRDWPSSRSHRPMWQTSRKRE